MKFAVLSLAIMLIAGCSGSPAVFFKEYEPVETESYSIELSSVYVGSDPESSGGFESLRVVFFVRNKQDRLALELSPIAGKIVVKDDVGNSVRRIPLAYENLIEGTQVAPGKASVCVDRFALPFPKTQHLIISLDTSVIAGEKNPKTLRFKVEWPRPEIEVR